MEREDMDNIVSASEWKGYWESLINEKHSPPRPCGEAGGGAEEDLRTRLHSRRDKPLRLWRSDDRPPRTGGGREMSVRRFDVYCNGGWDGCTTYEDDCDNGDYVTFADYAALLARHNALVEAVTILQKLDMGRGRSLTMVEVGLLIDARAEVNRLLLGES